ncbi:MAG TPA: hypothetical protein VGC82_18520, partial [Rhodopila sp.]
NPGSAWPLSEELKGTQDMDEQADEKNPPKEQGLPQRGPAQPAGHDDPREQSVPRHTAGGAPTDAAHQDAGDGALTGSVPAGLTARELLDGSRDVGRDDPGTE